MLKISGKLVTVKQEKTKKDKIYKRLQLMTNGQQDTVQIQNVKDFQNRDHSKMVGKEVEIQVYVFPWVGKSGVPSLDFVMV
jgi:hypothetical protein